MTAAVVLGVAGYVAEPYARDWMLAGSACHGALPRDVVDRLTPEGAHLDSEESRQSDGLGSYGCDLTIEGDEIQNSRLIEMEAYTRRDDQDREFFGAFPEEGFSRQGVLPDGLPGFIDDYRAINLLLPCPDLGEDAEGRQRKLLVRTWMGTDTLSGVPGAAYEAAVALTNSASERLGCGAEPLKAPKGGAVPADPEADPKTLSTAEAKGTACGWVAEAGLPKGADWRVEVGMNNAAPTGRCDVSSGDGESGSEKSLAFVAWYGDWSNRLNFEDGNGEFRSMTASARCDGEAANYALGGSEDIPGVGKAAQQRLLKRFAQDQVNRRGCSDLRFHF
ncbi:hypothetical protein [Streptomyces sporangiiformans]|uniref:DUF3558 domain-containing protein n=1 Tax=Streptomyces sporangiiformans TaxID=2315329 RepID=A0A505DQU3_9ACTN|nr:hypothetical protein [Streptomyces sporangiiformans]TPQ23609.1 hypothetical protein FGD71_003260 [Streptomyces sporangiiformans]